VQAPFGWDVIGKTPDCPGLAEAVYPPLNRFPLSKPLYLASNQPLTRTSRKFPRSDIANLLQKCY